jgi:RNA polymerase sigma-70 factor (ECF subfamily)
MTLPGTADDDLIRLATGGDRDAFTALVRRHDDRMRGLAYKLLGDAGRMDDALQNAYLQAFLALPRFRRDANFASWLYRIVYNASIDEARRAMRRPEPVDPSTGAFERGDPSPSPEIVVSSNDATVRALATLPLDQRVTVVLVDGEGVDHATAARILRVAPGTVASRLSRARVALRRVLGEESR